MDRETEAERQSEGQTVRGERSPEGWAWGQETRRDVETQREIQTAKPE